jgi:hypothetical protein
MLHCDDEFAMNPVSVEATPGNRGEVYGNEPEGAGVHLYGLGSHLRAVPRQRARTADLLITSDN